MIRLLAGLVLTMVVMLAGCTVSLSPSGSTTEVSTNTADETASVVSTEPSPTTKQSTVTTTEISTTSTPSSATETSSPDPSSTSTRTETETITPTATETPEPDTETTSGEPSPTAETETEQTPDPRAGLAWVTRHSCDGHDVYLGSNQETHEYYSTLNYTLWTTSDESETLTVVADAHDAGGVIETQSEQVVVPAGETANVTVEMEGGHLLDEVRATVRGCEQVKLD